jgi:two-component system CheB/CheR fusion protein
MSEAPERKRRSRQRRQKDEGGNHNFFAVGIGASAGGIKALERFFENAPKDSGMAYAVILHLSPEHESTLAEMMQRKTEMPVIKVVEAVKVEPNHVYVIPPAKDLVITDGFITVQEPEQRKGPPSPVDLFFRTLGAAYGPHAIGIVLSGTGTDGTLGLKRIKEEGGLAFAQDLREAEYDGMPRSAISAGLVDFVLPVAEIPQKLISLRQTAEKIRIPVKEVQPPPQGSDDEVLHDILALMRISTGHNFTNYKRSTVLRRIARRMQVNGVETLSDYLQLMRENPKEVKELQHDMLITVTNFFRDTEAFQILEREVVPKIFLEKTINDRVRVWVTGCASGEEAYSLAILMQEHAESLDSAPQLQIFATDIDEESITQAREGVFPETIAADVPLERLKRYFTREGQHYRVKKEIREIVLFAPHNILRDPPFSRLDMVSCRNLLIYLNREAQDRVLELFHFSLKPSGFLFLGSSESAESLPELFVPLDKKHRVFRRTNIGTTSPFIPAMPFPGKWDARIQEALATPVRKPVISYGELHQIMVEQFAPPSVLVNEGHDIVHLSEKAGTYLRFMGGEPSRNVLKAVHPDLRLDLRAALFTASHEGQETTTRRVSMKVDGQMRFVKMIVRPVKHADLPRNYLLVIFDEGMEELPPTPASTEVSEARAALGAGEMEQIVRHLEDELERTKTVLRTTVEQYETSTEELKASNEELQAINEELRSASEELETSKEELQSLNEELQTVNAELTDKINEVRRVNSDLQNLLYATDVATIFLDRRLRIKRYTPAVEGLFNVIATDVGRPLQHLTNRLDYQNLAADAERVMDKLERVEREIRGTDSNWYIVRMMPYRTIEDRIEGVVLTFVNISERKKVEEALIESEERLRLTVESITDYAIFTTDTEGRIKTWNAGAERIFGYTEEEAVGQPAGIIFTPEDRASEAPEAEMRQAQHEGRAADERWHMSKRGARFYVSGVMSPLRDSTGALTGFVKVARDLTEQRRAEEDREMLVKQVERERARLEEGVKERTHALMLEITERRNAEERVKDLLRRVVRAQELERRRISRDLHDQLGQQLTALRLNLQSLHARCGDEDEELCEQVAQAQSVAERLDNEVDFLAWELRPAALDEAGLVAALENFVQEWSKHFNIKADYHTARLGNVRLSPEAETSLYRIAQEALNNVYKHSGATRVDVLFERRDQHAVLIIEDDGRGFDTRAVADGERGMGLLNMRERAALIGGALDIESVPDEGTTVFVRVPLQQSEKNGGLELKSD